MDDENQKSSTRKLRQWFRREQKRPEPFYLGEVTDWEEDESEDHLDDVLIRPINSRPCTLTNELRVFVGTWNVAGRSPIGTLAVDVDEWLNLKDAADMYVLGLQEIVPLTARNVIGAEDLTEATNWNQLIGKTLNDKYGCPWLTPTQNSTKSDNFHYREGYGSRRRASFSNILANPRNRHSFQYELPDRCSRYKLIASKKMVGVFITVWMKRELLERYCISTVKVCSVACGIMGRLGNKGSISVSMLIEGTSFCFIVAHLASGEKKGDEGQRNHQVSEIFRRTSFPRSQDSDNHHPSTILGHDRIFWFGDLNYRLYSEDNVARKLIQKQDWRALQEFDQLRKELEDGGVFQGWKEGNIQFAPTYKYSSSNCNRYSGSLPSRAREKQRTPAWCDRILWYGKGVEQISYFRSESKFSDHRPVSALFLTQIDIKSSNPMFIPLQPNIPSRAPASHFGQGKTDGEGKSTLLVLNAKVAEALPSHMKKTRSKGKYMLPNSQLIIN